MDYSTMPPMITTKQAAEILNVDPRTVMRMCRAGKVRCAKVMSAWRVNRDALLEQFGLKEGEGNGGEDRGEGAQAGA